MRRIAPIGAAALMLTLFTLAGGPGAIAHRDDDRDRHTCKRNPNCVATITVRTTTTVLGDRTVTLTQTQTVAETATTTVTERGATRLDDQASDAAMEQRKKEGYF